MAIKLETFVIIRVFANCSQVHRGSIWYSITNSFNDLIVLIDDLNMVEISGDRFFINRSRIIVGPEKISWDGCKNHFNLVDNEVTDKSLGKTMALGIRLEKKG